MAVQFKIRFVILLYVHEALYNMYLMQREVVIPINAELLLLSETGQSFVLSVTWCETEIQFISCACFGFFLWSSEEKQMLIS